MLQVAGQHVILSIIGSLEKSSEAGASRLDYENYESQVAGTKVYHEELGGHSL